MKEGLQCLCNECQIPDIPKATHASPCHNKVVFFSFCNRALPLMHPGPGALIDRVRRGISLHSNRSATGFLTTWNVDKGDCVAAICASRMLSLSLISRCIAEEEISPEVQNTPVDRAFSPVPHEYQAGLQYEVRIN